MHDNNLGSGLDPEKWEEECEMQLVADIKYIQEALLPVNVTNTLVFQIMKGFGFGEFPLQYKDIESIHRCLIDTETGTQIKARFIANDKTAVIHHGKLLVKRNTVYLFGRFITDIITPEFVLESILDPGFYILPMEMYDSVLEILTKNYYEHI